MNQSQAADVLLVRALEEADPHGQVLDAETRAAAGRAALRQAGIASGERSVHQDQLDALLAGRAEALRQRVATRAPELARMRDAVLRPGPFTPLLAILALAAGAALGSLGAGRTVSIVAFPLLGLIVWNLAVYAALLLAPAVGGGRSRPAAPWVAWLARSREWAAAGLAHRLPRGGPPEAVAAVAGERFLREWLRASRPILAARARTAFHLAAAALALGTVGGMYLRGLVFEYRAGWESTFLDADAVHALLSALLAPASALTGIPLPDTPHIAALRFSPEQPGENAAPWIHLYAATAGICVILPRLVLAAFDGRKARRLANRFPLGRADPYYRRTTDAVLGRVSTLTLVPYSAPPAPERLPALVQALGDALEERLEVTEQPPIAYGAEEHFLAEPLPPSLVGADHAVLAVGLAATPEDEVHGRLLAGLGKARREAGRSDPVILLLDEAPYRERLGPGADAERRLTERLAAWRRLAEARGARVVSVGGGRSAP